MTERRFDFVVVGAGPAGQKAALQAAAAGCSVAIVDQQRQIGGDCVHRGTIPSKALRETAMQISAARRTVAQVRLAPRTPMVELLHRVEAIVDANVAVQSDELARSGIEVMVGRARFSSPTALVVQPMRGAQHTLRASTFVIATGSVPRNPPETPVDHASVLDSDSILSIPYLPDGLVVLGGGVIACEYASTFAALGVSVTVVDRAPRPLSFMDTELTGVLLRSWAGAGARYLAGTAAVSIDRGAGGCRVHLASGSTLDAEKVMVALGRVANVARLGLDAAGVRLTSRGQVEVDATYRTSAPHIYAVGDVIGFPALAATSMEQGRRCARHALGLAVAEGAPVLPVGIYTIPELGQVGLSEQEALAQYGEIRVARCGLDEVARGQIAGLDGGLLKLVADASGRTLLGVSAAGHDANELVHLGQLAMVGNLPPSTFVDVVWNFPTRAEAYRIAALRLERSDALRVRQEIRAAG